MIKLVFLVLLLASFKAYWNYRDNAPYDGWVAATVVAFGWLASLG